MAGYSSVFNSRRTDFEIAKWWNQKESPNGSRIDLNKMCHETKPEGIFFCSEERNISDVPDKSGDFYYTSLSVTVSTADDIYGKIHNNSIVLYRNRIWKVVSIQLKPEWKHSQFMNNALDGRKVITLVS